MLKRFGLTTAAALVFVTAWAPLAFASDSLSEPPAPNAELVRREVATGVEAASAVLETVDSVRVGQQATVITVRGDAGPHPITVDYSEVAQDRKTAGVGYLAGAYLVLGILARLARAVRGASGLLG